MGQPKSGKNDFDLKWAGPNREKMILTWNGPAQIRKKWIWLETIPPDGAHCRCVKVISPWSDLRCRFQRFVMLFRIRVSQLVPEKTLTIAGYFVQKTEKSHLLICPDLGWPISSQTQFLPIWAGPFQEFWTRGVRGFKQTAFWGVLLSFSSQFFASRQSLCTWHGYFEKKTDLPCLLWQYRPLKQNSAAPQGSPPPTQQIKIQIQISWVGWSTRG